MATPTLSPAVRSFLALGAAIEAYGVAELAPRAVVLAPTFNGAELILAGSALLAFSVAGLAAGFVAYRGYAL